MRSNEKLRSLMDRRCLTLSLAESCTGGLIGKTVTDIPGASSFFMGSAVTYSNDAKEKVLGVPHSTILAFGAVSGETAEAMAHGSLDVFGSDIAASVTGIAGPGGATDKKPVGTVWMAVTDGKRSIVRENHLNGGRDKIRQMSAEILLEMIIEFIEGL